MMDNFFDILKCRGLLLFRASLQMPGSQTTTDKWFVAMDNSKPSISNKESVNVFSLTNSSPSLISCTRLTLSIREEQVSIETTSDVSSIIETEKICTTTFRS